MKTDALIDLLARGAGPVDRYAVARRLAVALTVGIGIDVLLFFALFGINPALPSYVGLPLFWIKVGFVGLLGLAGVIATSRLARPGVAVGGAVWLGAIPLVVVWLLAAGMLLAAEPDARLLLVLGDSWRQCPVRIALLSAPLFGAGVWALRGLAPTAQRRAGMALGLGSGALGACIYALYCPELAPPFIGAWYVLGMLVPGLVGLAIGPRVLRW